MSQKTFRSAVLILLMVGAASAHAAVTYSYEGPPYGVNAGPYTADMNLTITFTMDAPLPPSSAVVIYGGDPGFPATIIPASSWSIDDGVNMLDSSNAVGFAGPSQNFGIQVSTDANGDIFFAQFFLVSPRPPQSVGDTLVALFGVADETFFGLTSESFDCLAVNEAGICTLGDEDSLVVSEIDVESGGTWTGEEEPAVGIPALSPIGLALLALLLGLDGWRRHRRRSAVKA